jgi:hypothetical protein
MSAETQQPSFYTSATYRNLKYGKKGDKTTSIWLHQHSEQRLWIGSRYFKMGTGVLNKKSSSGFFGVLSDDDVVD